MLVSVIASIISTIGSAEVQTFCSYPALYKKFPVYINVRIFRQEKRLLQCELSFGETLNYTRYRPKRA